MIRFLRSATGQDINGFNISTASLAASETLSPDNNDEICLAIYRGSTVTTAAITLTTALQFSPDDGTTWFAVPQDSPSTTASSIVGTYGTYAMAYWKLPVVESDSVGSNPLYRFAFTPSNTGEVFVGCKAWVGLRKRAQLAP